jgi:tRNA threonylcarbamoyladenosine biosynthesis protein TsaB
MGALIIDTSSKSGFLAVAQNGVVVKAKTIEDARQLSKFLLPSIETLWQDQFDFIAIGIGPGSYTGTRIGASVAKSLAFALNLPLIGFSSSLLPDLDQIAALTYEKYQNQQFDPQIELVYFSSTS